VISLSHGHQRRGHPPRKPPQDFVRRQLTDATAAEPRSLPAAAPPITLTGLRALFRPQAYVVQVVPGLRIGSLTSARQARRLMAEGINCVVDVRPEGDTALRWPEGVLFTRVPMGGERLPTVSQLLEAASFVVSLMSVGNEVLVHCRDGLDRAPVVACAALILQGSSVAEARQRIAACRGDAALREDQVPLLREIEAGLPTTVDGPAAELVGHEVRPTATLTTASQL
jgi:hypothetical protein